MIRSALLISAGLVAALFGCVVPSSEPTVSAAPPPAPPPAPIAARVALNPKTVCPALGNIQVVPASFDPTSATDTPPTSGPAPANIQADIVATAQNIAPGYFLTQLCGLDGIFITASQDPWGYRNINNGKRYIAIPLGLWGSGGAVGLDRYMNRVFEALPWPPPPHAPPPANPPVTDPTPPAYLPPMPNTTGMTILAALAHEFGHVFWTDVLISPRGTLPQSRRFCSRILDESWSGGPHSNNFKWQEFDEPDNNPADIGDDPSDPPAPGDPGPGEAKVLRMIAALQSGHVPRAHRILWRILAPGRPFPSLLGAFSANEQFVETFELYTLLHAQTPLKSLPLQVSADLPPRDIPQDLSRPPTDPQSRKKLRRALACFDSLVPPS